MLSRARNLRLRNFHAWLLDGPREFCYDEATRETEHDHDICEKLQDIRKKAGMSQDALAEKLDVSRQAVSRWERDETLPETEKVVLLADLFCVTTDYLLRPQLETPEPTYKKRASRFLTEYLGTLARILGWAAVAWGALALLYQVLTGQMLGILPNAPLLFLRACLYPILLAVLKIAVGIALIRFGRQYEHDKKERR